MNNKEYIRYLTIFYEMYYNRSDFYVRGIISIITIINSLTEEYTE